MRPALLIAFATFGLALPLHGQDSPYPDGTLPRQYGGFQFIRQGNQTTISLGGVLFNRRVRVTTATPEGPVVTRFLLPSAFHTPNAVPLPGALPAMIRVEISDEYGLLYIEGQKTATLGKVRQLESPPLPPSQLYPLHLRAAFQRGGNLLIEDKQVQIGAGSNTIVVFEGNRALVVPLPKTRPAPTPLAGVVHGS